MLRDLDIHTIYRTGEQNFDKDFLIPCYKNSVEYLRGSGFFTISSLVRSIEGIIDFVERNGKMKLVCNPKLNPDDFKLILAGLSESQVSEILKEEIRQECSPAEGSALDVICNMIQEGYLEIKIAYMEKGIYHEKFGVFTDKNSDRVSFNGSNNETSMAISGNYESFETNLSWYSGREQEKVNNQVSHFQRLWENKENSIKVMSFPEAVKQELFDMFKESPTLAKAIDNYIKSTGEKKKELYPYQERAIEEFVENDFCHFYEMATGTGKTFTAIKSIRRAEKELEKKLLVIICVPQVDLQNQWKKALEEEGYEKIHLMGGMATGNKTSQEINKALISICSKRDTGSVICICTYDAFFDKFAQHVQNLKNKETLLIVDEAHNLTNSNMSSLPSNIVYRLGLSATILRYKEEETQNILAYFLKDKDESFKYGIEEAIENGFLSHYQYYPIPVEMPESKFEEYQRKTKQLITQFNLKAEERDQRTIEDVSQARARLVKKCSTKIEKLEEMLASENYDFKNAVVYCGMGLAEDDADGSNRIIDEVTIRLNKAGLVSEQFTSNTEDRPGVLEAFEDGTYDTLAAIKCFDEGVDVPKLDKIYIMASDNSMRQTVQRRGRVLRQCKSTHKSIAYIFDMITLPPSSYINNEIGVKSLISNELSRAFEYNRLADNKDVNENIFDEWLSHYNMSHNDLISIDTTDTSLSQNE